MINRRCGKTYLWIHALIAGLLILFPLYRRVTASLPDVLVGCLLHDRLFLYCPLCGGTRALTAILQFDFANALRYNPLVVLLGLLTVALDLVALIRLLRGRARLLPLPGWFWIALAVLLVLFAVLRNVLMIAYGYDPVGDLGTFWRCLTEYQK